MTVLTKNFFGNVIVTICFQKTHCGLIFGAPPLLVIIYLSSVQTVFALVKATKFPQSSVEISLSFYPFNQNI